MKKLVAVLLLVLGGCSPKHVAKLTIQPNRVLYVSDDLHQVSEVDSIARIRPTGFLGTKNIRLTLQNGERQKVARKDIWGYSDEKGHVWRRFRKSFYEVVRVSDVVEYEVIEPRNVGNNIVIYEPITLYSKTLNSKIVGSRKRALRTGDEQNGE